MRTLYLDCSMGAAGDMLSAALLELLPDREAFVEKFNALGIPGVSVALNRAVKCGVTGSSFQVTVNGQEEDEHLHHHDHEHDHEHEHHHDHDHEHEHHDHEHHHHHSGMGDIEHIVRDHLALPAEVKENILSVYQLIAEAESKVHGTTVKEIHFHEVGTMDAVADVTAVCLLLHTLGPLNICASPVNVGGGTVRCAHGVLSVPAPATAELLRGIPSYGGEIQSELCTPTGAALLRHFVTAWGPMPMMRTAAIGCGCGKKDFPQANCLRAFLGEDEGEKETLYELSCDLDDMTGEELGFAEERLFDAGALDVYTVAVGMKKNRPGVLLRVLCREGDKARLIETMFRHTSTLGVRETEMRRHVLNREIRTLDTPYGALRVKTAEGFGVRREKPEFEDLARIAREKGISLREARALAEEK